MNTYLVTLTLTINGYEKLMPHVIQTDNEDDARDQALLDESHNEDAGFDSYGVWCDDCMIYSVFRSQLLTAEQAAVLNELRI